MAPRSALPPLDLPPTAQTQARLLRWQRQATCAARWQRARTLLDLHDVELFLRGESDRVSEVQRQLRQQIAAFLRRALGLDETAIAEAARRTALRGLLAPLPSGCPAQAARARQALALLKADETIAEQGRPTKPKAALRLAIAYKQVLLEESELAANARLRLVDWCADATRDAVRAPPPRQQAALNQCLFALFDADPSPYFEADAARRPPDPPWTILLSTLEGELRQLEKSRFRKVAELQRSFDADYFLTAKAELPVAVDYQRLALPASVQGLPHDRTPVVTVTPQGFLVDNLLVPLGAEDQLRAALVRRLRGDRRASLTVVARPDTSLYGLFELGRAARRLKVATLLIGVRRKVADAAPRGDVQARLARGAVWRLEGLPLSIRLLSIHPGEPSRDRPRQLLFDPRSVQARVALGFGPHGARVSSNDGRSPRWPGLPELKLRRWLHRLRAVYPRESALLLAPARRATFAQLVRLISVARYDQRQPLFPSLALTTKSSIVPPPGDLGRFIEAWLAARVRVAPAGAGDSTALLRCYRAALRAAQRRAEALPAGVLRLSAGRRWPSKMLGDPLLARCTAAALGKRTRRSPALELSFTLPAVGGQSARAPGGGA